MVLGELGYRVSSRGWIPSISALRLIGAVPSEWWESSGIDWVVGAGFPLLAHSGSLVQCPVIGGRARV